jgi:hypothetical protein
MDIIQDVGCSATVIKVCDIASKELPRLRKLGVYQVSVTVWACGGDRLTKPDGTFKLGGPLVSLELDNNTFKVEYRTAKGEWSNTDAISPSTVIKHASSGKSWFRLVSR